MKPNTRYKTPTKKNIKNSELPNICPLLYFRTTQSSESNQYNCYSQILTDKKMSDFEGISPDIQPLSLFSSLNKTPSKQPKNFIVINSSDKEVVEYERRYGFLISPGEKTNCALYSNNSEIKDISSSGKCNLLGKFNDADENKKNVNINEDCYTINSVSKRKSQNSVMGGSAKELLIQKINELIYAAKNESDKKEFYTQLLDWVKLEKFEHKHIQAHSIGGKETRDNLLIGAHGSNTIDLFVDLSLKYLFLHKIIPEGATVEVSETALGNIGLDKTYDVFTKSRELLLHLKYSSHIPKNNVDITDFHFVYNLIYTLIIRNIKTIGKKNNDENYSEYQIKKKIKLDSLFAVINKN